MAMIATTVEIGRELIRAALAQYAALLPGDTRLADALAAGADAVDALVADLGAASLATTAPPFVPTAASMTAVRRAAATHFAAIAAQYAAQALAIRPVLVDRSKPGRYRPEPTPATYDAWDASNERAARVDVQHLLGMAQRSLRQSRETAS